MPALALAAAVLTVTPLHFVHPHAKVLIGVNWREIASSPAGELIRKQIPPAAQQGLEFVEELDRVLVSSTGKPGSFLVFAEGRFNLTDLRNRAAEEGARKTTYKLIEILSAPVSDGLDVHLAILSSRAILLGDRASVYAAIDRKGPLADNPLFERAAELAAAHEVWAIFATPPRTLSPERLASLPLASGIESLEGGLSVRDGIGLELRLNAKSPDAARALAAGFQALQQQGDPQLTELLRNLQIAPDHSTVHVALAIDPQNIAQGVTLASSSAPKPKPAEPSVIRIYGLDGGPREIPFSN